MSEKTRNLERTVRHDRLRKKVSGTAERPRLHVFKSHKNFYLQLIDDLAGQTLVAVSTQEPEIKQSAKTHGNVTTAKMAGALVAQRALAKGISKVVFDRGGHHYHGAVKTLAEAAREAGLKF